MAISALELVGKTTAELIDIRSSYQRRRVQIPRQHRSARSQNLSTDIRRCDDAIRLINSILKKRQPRRRPLGDFGS